MSQDFHIILAHCHNTCNEWTPHSMLYLDFALTSRSFSLLLKGRPMWVNHDAELGFFWFFLVFLVLDFRLNICETPSVGVAGRSKG